MINSRWIYTQTVKAFAAGAHPAFEDAGGVYFDLGQRLGSRH